MSESEDSDIENTTLPLLHSMQEMMLSMVNEVDASLEDLHRITHDIHHSQDLFTHLHIQETLQPLLQRWASAKRISDDGLSITLSDEEQKEFGLPDANTTIYAVCVALIEKKTGK